MSRTNGFAQCAECSAIRKPAFQHTFYNSLHTRIVLLLHPPVAPENQHVGCIKYFFTKPLLLRVETRVLHQKPVFLLEVSRDGLAQKLVAVRLLLLRLLLVPNQYADGISGLREIRRHQQKGRCKEGAQFYWHGNKWGEMKGPSSASPEFRRQ